MLDLKPAQFSFGLMAQKAIRGTKPDKAAISFALLISIESSGIKSMGNVYSLSFWQAAAAQVTHVLGYEKAESKVELRRRGASKTKHRKRGGKREGKTRSKEQRKFERKEENVAEGPRKSEVLENAAA